MERNTPMSFYKTVQAGDITLFDILEESIAFFGYTRRGKTTSCHFLSQSPIKSQYKNNQLIYVASTYRFQNAKIGITHESETWIPNIFNTMVKENNVLKPIYVLDQPGYGDTYGFYRIFSNGYFHYRTFSKTPKLKFVLTISIQDLRSTGQSFTQTVRKFMNTFNDWQKVKQNILKATTILVTKVEPQTTQQTLLDMIYNLRSTLKGSLGAMFTQFVMNMYKNRKVFFIRKPNRVNQVVEDKTLLQRIYDRTEFWQRPLLRKNIVDVSEINFEVSSEILNKLKNKDEQLFKEQFEQYMEWAQDRIYEFILNHPGSLLKTIKCLESDAKGSIGSHKFLDLMRQFNQTHYNFIESYERKRKATIVNLFKSAEEAAENGNQNEVNQRSNLYFIKKFKVIEQIVKMNTQIMAKENVNSVSRSIEELEDFSNKFMQMFRKMSILGIQRTDREEVIYKYSYILQRLIQESKIMTLVLFKDQSIKKQISEMRLKVISEDIYRVLLDKFFLSDLCELKVEETKREFIQKLNFEQISSPTQEFIDFLQSATNQQSEKQDNQLKQQGVKPYHAKKSQITESIFSQHLVTNEEQLNQIKVKMAECVLKFYNTLFSQDRNPEQSQIKYMIKKLYFHRQYFYQLRSKILHCPQSQLQKCVQLTVHLTEAIGNTLKKLQLFEATRNCFKTIQDADAIFDVYETEANKIKKDARLYRQLLIKQAQDANFFYRKELALACYQKAFSISRTFKDKKEVSQKIVSCCNENKEQDEHNKSYLKKIFDFNQTVIEDFSQSLKATIQAEFDRL